MNSLTEKQKLEYIINKDICGSWKCERCPINDKHPCMGTHRNFRGDAKQTLDSILMNEKKIKIWKMLK